MQESRLLRIADRHVGSMLCGGISFARFLLPRQANKAKKSVEKILLVELFEMGAAIMLLPSIRKIKEEFPHAEIHCLTTSSCFPVWKATNAIDGKNIHVINGKSALSFVFSSLAMLYQLRSIRFDLVIDYELFMRISAVLVGALRAKFRAGFYKYNFEGLNRGSFYDYICAYNQNSHISKNLLALTKTALSGAGDLPNFKGTITPEEIRISPMISAPGPEGLSRILGIEGESFPYFVICPDVGNTLAMRNYPLESLAVVIKQALDQYPSHRAVFIGTDENKVPSQKLLALMKGNERCINLCGKTNFSELMQIIAGADLLLTNDNGPGHFASLTGTKTVALFSTDSPFVYGPLGKSVIAYSYYHCSPCISAYNHKKSSCDDNKCLQALPPKKINELMDAVMQGRAKFQTINNEIPYVF